MHFSSCVTRFLPTSFSRRNASDVRITLHKLLFPEGQLPQEQINSGEGTLLQAYRGLNDVTYHVYDVTDSFYQLREDGESVELRKKSWLSKVLQPDP